MIMLPRTHIHKIPPDAQHAPLHYCKIVDINILMHCTFTYTIKHSTNENCHNIQAYPDYIIIYTKISGCRNVPNDTWHTKLNPGVIKVRLPGRTTTFSKLKNTALPDTYQLAKKSEL